MSVHMFLSNTAGMNSRTRKLNIGQVLEIRKEYDEGKRGKDNANRWGISQSTYNAIGTRKLWSSIPLETLRQH